MFLIDMLLKGNCSTDFVHNVLYLLFEIFPLTFSSFKFVVLYHSSYSYAVKHDSCTICVCGS